MGFRKQLQFLFYIFKFIARNAFLSNQDYRFEELILLEPRVLLAPTLCSDCFLSVRYFKSENKIWKHCTVIDRLGNEENA